MLKDDRIDAGFPERRIAGRFDAAHPLRERVEPLHLARGHIEAGQVAIDAEHAPDQGSHARSFARQCIDLDRERAGLGLTHRHERGPGDPVERAQVPALRVGPVDNIRRQAAQHRDRQIEPVGRNDRDPHC